MFEVDATHIVTRIINVERARRGPRFEPELKLFRWPHLRLFPAHAVPGAAIECDANAVDLQTGEAINAFADNGVVAPAQEPVSCGPVVKIMLAAAFPDEVPGMLAIHA